MSRVLSLLLAVLIVHVTFGQEIQTYAGGGTSGLGDGGNATAASLGYFAGICFDKNGNLYIADGNNNRVRMVDSTHQIITTVAGTGASGFYGDSGPATNAQLDNPTWVAVDSSDNLYITDALNNRIRKVEHATGIISTIAGNGITGYSGDGGPAIGASFNAIQGLAVDKQGNLFVVDAQNYRIRKIVLATGIITTVIGVGIAGFSGDRGPASAARINGAYGICVDKDGNLLFADRSNSRVRKVTNDGTISSIAGNGTSSYAGDGLAATDAQLDAFAVAADKVGNIYIADYENSRIRKVNLDGTISTIAGTGVAGYSGDGGAATVAKINRPQGVSIDLCGNLFIADFNNKVVRKVILNPDCLPVSVKDARSNEAISVTLHPNPATETLTIAAGVEIESVSVMNAIGQCLKTADGRGSKQLPLNVSNLPPGVYMVRVNETWVGKFVKE